MKKLISLTLVCILLMTTFTFPASAANTADEYTEIDEGIILETAEGLYNTGDVQTLSSSELLVAVALNLTKTSNGLVMFAQTKSDPNVTKCGFTYIKLQRLINGVWTDYTPYCYTDQYADSVVKTFSKTVTPPTGYTYRLVCEHYAEKKKFLFFKDTETYYNVTSTLVYS